jgi:hypothetical protein
MTVWSLPLVTIKGNKHGLKVDMGKEALTTGWKFNIFGYKSSGERVPDVITTVSNRSNMSLSAIDASIHVNCKSGSVIPPYTLP